MKTEEVRKRGRVAGPATERYQVLLDEDIAEWAKREPDGLSGTIRRLLRQEYEAANQSRQSTVQRMFSRFLADRGSQMSNAGEKSE